MFDENYAYDRCENCYFIACDNESYPDNCDGCWCPEISKDGTLYRDICDICSAPIMIPMRARDHNNFVVCKRCSKDPYDDQGNILDAPIGDYNGVFIEGGREWWNDPV